MWERAGRDQVVGGSRAAIERMPRRLICTPQKETGDMSGTVLLVLCPDSDAGNRCDDTGPAQRRRPPCCSREAPEAHPTRITR